MTMERNDRSVFALIDKHRMHDYETHQSGYGKIPHPYRLLLILLKRLKLYQIG